MSSDLNTISVTGRCTRDAEVRDTKNGDRVCNVAIACNGYKKDEPPTFFDLVIWGKKAGVAPFLKKGQPVGVSGRFALRQFEKRDGSRGVAAEITVAEITLVGGKREASSDGPIVERRGKPAGGWDDSGGGDDLPF
jgi:single-strand DNA-binding protein